MSANLDPSGEYTPAEIEKSLKDVKFWNYFTGRDEHKTIDLILSENTRYLKRGWYQAFQLAKVKLRNQKVLIFNGNWVKDDQIQDTIKILFKDCTILHMNPAIEKVVEADRVLMLNKEGSLLEFDQPFKLLVN